LGVWLSPETVFPIAEWLALMSRYKGKSGYADDKYELLCFNALIPVPNKVLMKGFDPQGYNWEMEHWGCKWGACDIKRRVLPPLRKEEH
jgi:hypothetical protein